MGNFKTELHMLVVFRSPLNVVHQHLALQYRGPKGLADEELLIHRCIVVPDGLEPSFRCTAHDKGETASGALDGDANARAEIDVPLMDPSIEISDKLIAAGPQVADIRVVDPLADCIDL